MHTTQRGRSEEKAQRKNPLFWSQENQVGEEGGYSKEEERLGIESVGHKTGAKRGRRGGLPGVSEVY